MTSFLRRDRHVSRCVMSKSKFLQMNYYSIELSGGYEETEMSSYFYCLIEPLPQFTGIKRKKKKKKCRYFYLNGEPASPFCHTVACGFYSRVPVFNRYAHAAGVVEGSRLLLMYSFTSFSSACGPSPLLGAKVYLG